MLSAQREQSRESWNLACIFTCPYRENNLTWNTLQSEDTTNMYIIWILGKWQSFRPQFYTNFIRNNGMQILTLLSSKRHRWSPNRDLRLHRKVTFKILLPEICLNKIRNSLISRWIPLDLIWLKSLLTCLAHTTYRQKFSCSVPVISWDPVWMSGITERRHVYTK